MTRNATFVRKTRTTTAVFGVQPGTTVQYVWTVPDLGECPICGTVAEVFDPAGIKRVEPDRSCPGCGSLERHRAVWLLFRDRTDLFSRPTRLLHMAPELALGSRLKALPNVDYVSGDLKRGRGIKRRRVMRRLDLTCLDLPDDSFDAVYASHVLEHIPDDLAAMREIRRVLRPGGWAVLVVPMFGDATLEDPAVTDPVERARLFGQADHVRMYGWDGVYEERLESAGFKVTIAAIAADLGPKLARRYRVREGEPIHYCC